MIVAHDMHCVDVGASDGLSDVDGVYWSTNWHLQRVILRLNGHFWHFEVLLLGRHEHDLLFVEDSAVRLIVWGRVDKLVGQHVRHRCNRLLTTILLAIGFNLPGRYRHISLLHNLLDGRQRLLVVHSGDVSIWTHWELLSAQVVRGMAFRGEAWTIHRAITRQSAETWGLAQLFCALKLIFNHADVFWRGLRSQLLVRLCGKKGLQEHIAILLANFEEVHWFTLRKVFLLG